MKRITIILAILLTGFTVNAQSNRSRSERSTGSEPARKEEVKKTERTSQQPDRSSSSSTQRENTSRERNAAATKTTRPSGQDEQGRVSTPERKRTYDNNNDDRNRSNSGAIERSGGRTTYQNRETEKPRVRVEHPDTDRNRRVEGINHRQDPNTSYNPRRGERYEAQRRTYTYNHPNRMVRTAPKTHYAYKPIEYRRVHYIYRVPPKRTIVWNSRMYREYVYLYPEYSLWYYPFGYNIHTISAYDADRYIGEIARVYGEVYDTWYSSKTDEYYLYIGGPYPYQDLTIVMKGSDARRFSSRPARHFSGRHIEATGLIGIFEGKPEMFIKKRSQLGVY